MPSSQTATPSRATQEFVPIKEVRDGIVILKDGSLRRVLMASSINLALKSADEQEAIISQFQNFLNSLEFPVQFFIESRKLDIRPYIALLEDRLSKEIDDLMKLQIREYIMFIREFTDRSNIMSKNFFISVPYDPSLIAKGGGGALGSILGGSTAPSQALSNEQFEEYRSQLEQRIGVIEQGLVRTGVRVVPLGTEELIELFYKLFNPGELEKPMAVASK
ncbi:MAG TPA: hypothetical protein VF803_03815 [Candidatus Paceibacterota bacterium]